MRKYYLFQTVNKATVEMLEESPFWEKFNIVRSKIQEFETTINSGFMQPKIRLRIYDGMKCLDLLQKAECFERFANAFFHITRDLLGADMSATVSQREECLIYSYMRLKLLIEEIERDVERARSVPVMPRRRRILNSGTKIKLTKPENIGKSRRTQKP